MHVHCVLLLFLYHIRYVIPNTTTLENAAREAINACRNLTAPHAIIFPDPTCWDTLDMGSWMSNWNLSTTKCSASQDLLDPCQCAYGEAWATCFMRLTFEGDRTADWECTTITSPQTCTEPEPSHIVQGPAEIYYGSYSIWALTQYLSAWYTALASPSAMPAIEAQLQNDNDGAISTKALLSLLVQNYASNTRLATSLSVVVTEGPIDIADQIQPTLKTAQGLLGDLLAGTLNEITSDWAGGDFMFLGTSGGLLNNTEDTVEYLMSRLARR